MRRQMLLLNLVMLAIVVLAASHLSSSWKEFRQTNNLERIVKKDPGGDAAPVAAPPAGVEEPQPLPEFLVIAEKNLFAPERRPEAARPPTPPPQPPPLPMKPVLQGISKVGGKKQAFLTVFEGANGQVRPVSEGDNVQGYTVSRITDKSVELRWNDQVVMVDFAGRPQQPAAVAKAVAATTIITVGAAAAAVATSGAPAPEQPGLQVSVVGAPAQGQGQQQGMQGGMRQGMSGGRGMGTGMGMGTGTGGLGGQSNTLPSTVGIGGVGGTMQTPFGTVNRRQ